MGFRIRFSETYHSTHACNDTHTLRGGQLRSCILFTNCYGSLRQGRKKKSNPACITSEHVRVKMSKIIHILHYWANVVKRERKNTPSLKFPYYFSLLSSTHLFLPRHSERVLSIIKGTCGTNPCKSPVLSVLYLQATQHTEILHLHA